MGAHWEISLTIAPGIIVALLVFRIGFELLGEDALVLATIDRNHDEMDAAAGKSRHRVAVVSDRVRPTA